VERSIQGGGCGAAEAEGPDRLPRLVVPAGDVLMCTVRLQLSNCGAYAIVQSCTHCRCQPDAVESQMHCGRRCASILLVKFQVVSDFACDLLQNFLQQQV
jgi:hypothetical protein